MTRNRPRPVGACRGGLPLPQCWRATWKRRCVTQQKNCAGAVGDVTGVYIARKPLRANGKGPAWKLLYQARRESHYQIAGLVHSCPAILRICRIGQEASGWPPEAQRLAAVRRGVATTATATAGLRRAACEPVSLLYLAHVSNSNAQSQLRRSAAKKRMYTEICTDKSCKLYGMKAFRRAEIWQRRRLAGESQARPQRHGHALLDGSRGVSRTLCCAMLAVSQAADADADDIF